MDEHSSMLPLHSQGGRRLSEVEERNVRLTAAAATVHTVVRKTSLEEPWDKVDGSRW